MAGKVSRVSDELRLRIASKALPVGSRLPTEGSLATEFGVSRPTVRAALRELEALGMLETRHGVGSFVLGPPTLHAGLERLDSITASIQHEGRTPGMEYVRRVKRLVLPEEAARMGVAGDTEVLELRRTILADGEVVAYSYDLIPTSLLPEGFDANRLEGSLFDFFATELGIRAERGEAEVHAVHSAHIGWGREAQAHELFVLLDQMHYTEQDQLILYSRTYFIEGRYNFTIQRRR